VRKVRGREDLAGCLSRLGSGEVHRSEVVAIGCQARAVGRPNPRRESSGAPATITAAMVAACSVVGATNMTSSPMNFTTRPP